MIFDFAYCSKLYVLVLAKVLQQNAKLIGKLAIFLLLFLEYKIYSFPEINLSKYVQNLKFYIKTIVAY